MGNPRRPVMRALAGAAVLSVTLLASACGSGGSDDASDSPSSSATPPTSDQLAALLLQPGDLDSSYTAKASDSDSSDDAANNAQLAACVGGKDTSADKVADATSDDYAMGEITVSSDAKSYRTQDDIDSDVAVITDPKAEDCAKTLFTDQIAKSAPDATVESADVQIESHPSGLPSSVVALVTANVTLSEKGQEVTVYIASGEIAGDLVEGSVDVTSLGSAPPDDLVQSAVTAVANRVGG